MSTAAHGTKTTTDSAILSHIITAEATLSTAGDLDGDGDLDLVVDDSGWYENIDGAFETYHEFNSPVPDLTLLKLLDIGSDGDLDVIAANDSTAFLFENIDGRGDFRRIRADARRSIHVSDFDRDGYLDYLVERDTDECKDCTALWLDKGTPSGEFESELVGAGFLCTTSGYFRDYDGDGWDDVFYSSPCSFPDKVNVRLKLNRQGQLSGDSYYALGYADYFSETLDDIDQDNDLDIIQFDHSYDISWKIADSSRSGQSERISVLEHGHPITVRDFNGDGIMDLYYGGTEWLDGLTGQLHRPGDVPDRPSSPRRFTDRQLEIGNRVFLSFVDVDNDGHSEIIAKERTGQIVWLKDSDGNGDFESVQTIEGAGTGGLGTFVATDIDRDGDQDIVMFGHQNQRLTYVVIENADGNGSFFCRQPLPSLRLYEQVIVDDFDGDGDDDFLTVENSFDGKIAFLQNNAGELSSDELLSFRPGLAPQMKVIDFENDGDLDVIIPSMRIWLRNDVDQFHRVALSVYASGAFDFADTDHDSVPDTFAARSADSMQVYKFANGDFSLIHQFPIGVGREVRIADMNGDGKYDIVVGANHWLAWHEQFEPDRYSEVRYFGTSFVRAAETRLTDWDNDGDLDVLRLAGSSWTWLENRFVADTTNDGVFNSSDLVAVFQAGKFETAETADASQGDWNGDGVFNSADLVYVFQLNAYTYDARWASDLGSTLDSHWKSNAKQLRGSRR
ncbi:MAG: FG-GAP-like repeat-containing protein [Pirellulaceae bacterium]